MIRQVPLTRKDSPEDKEGFEAQRGEDLDFCIFELGAASTQWTLKEISAGNRVEMSLNKMSLYREILHCYHENHCPICEAQRVFEQGNFSQEVEFQRSGAESAGRC